jgi:hypothetical protein
MKTLEGFPIAWTVPVSQTGNDRFVKNTPMARFFLLLAAAVGCMSSARLYADPVLIEPGPLVEYVPFDPAAWAAGGFSTQFYPWKGQEIAFLTITDDLDPELMTQFVGNLDGGWALYKDFTGRSPSPFKMVDGLPTIAAIHINAPNCGAGCGFIGATGIQAGGFYESVYPALSTMPNQVPHLYFYEMGRNFYTFGDKHESFITGFAVFMRYVCIDKLDVYDAEPNERTKINNAINVYKNGSYSFLRTFTNGYGLTEKMERVPGCDQPVMYASMMLKLWKQFGDEWLRKFYREVMTCPGGSSGTEEGARKNALALFASASCAAGQDLSSIFVDEWRMILTANERAYLDGVNWSSPTLNAGKVVQGMLSSAPPVPTIPQDGATEVNQRQFLKWDYAGAATFDVYLWPQSSTKPATPTATGLIPKFFNPGLLLPDTTYQWTVRAHHADGASESTPISFTTASNAQEIKSIGWNYYNSTAGNTTSSIVNAAELAGIPQFAQKNWNNHAGSGQGKGSVPFALKNSDGTASGVQVSAWELAVANSWNNGYVGSDPNGKLMNSFNDKNPSLTFSGVPYDYRANGYSVVVYYGNNEGPSSSILSLQGSEDDLRTRTIRTGNVATSAYQSVAFVEGTDDTTIPTNYTIFTGLDDPSFTVSLANDNNNGISAIQIVKWTPPIPEEGSIGWNYDGSGDDTLSAEAIAGVAPFAQANWNNHAGDGAGPAQPATLPFALKDRDGKPSGVKVTSWTQTNTTSNSHAYTGPTANEKLMNSFARRRPSITFAGIPDHYLTHGYMVVVYYGSNSTAADSTLSIVGSINDNVSRTIRTGNTAGSGYRARGFVEEKGLLAGATNYTVFRGLNDPGFTVSLSVNNTNGISAVQIIKGFGLEYWQTQTPGAGTSPNADTDKDGWTDLMEYALGGDPSKGLPSDRPRLESSSGTTDFLYSRPKGRSDVIVELQGSIDCEHWFTITDVVPSVVTEWGVERYRYSNPRSTSDVPGLGSNGNGFFRLAFRMR